MFTLKDIKLPDYVVKSQKYSQLIPPQARNEPDDHYHFKSRLVWSLNAYLNNIINTKPDNRHNLYLRYIDSYKLTCEYYHRNVDVLSRLFDHTEEDKYLYQTDILLEIKFNENYIKRKNQIAFIEIDGLIHTKNQEQMHKNRLKYKALIDHYTRQNIFSTLSYIVFQVDEYKYNSMQYFINMILDTLMYNEPKYPTKFLWELTNSHND